MKYLKLWLQFVRFSLNQAAIYRVDITLRVIGMTLMAVIMMFVLMLPFRYVNELAGWEQHEILMVLGIYYIVNGMTWTFFRNGISRIETKVKRGTLDAILIKPSSSLFMVSFFEFDITRVVDIIVGFVIAAVQFSNTGVTLDPFLLVCAIVAMGSGFIIIFCLYLCVNTLSFWTTETYLDHVVNPIFTVAKYPVDIWGASFSKVLYWVLPVAFISTVPAGILLGKIPWWYAILGLALGLVWFGVVRVFWRFAVKSYSSVGN